MKSEKRNVKVVLILLLIAGALLRFYNLNWGSPFYFHPDERNIVDLVLKSSLTQPETLLKGTFAYGNFPVLLALLLKPLFVPFFQWLQIIDPFAQSVIILRTISAAFSIFMIPMLFVIGKYLYILCHPELVSGSKKIPDQVRNDSERVGLVVAFLATFSEGFIQQAHFGTYDGFIAFCALTAFYFSLRLMKSKNISNFYLSLLFIALGAATKINLLILGIFPVLVLFLSLKKRAMSPIRVFAHTALGSVLLVLLVIALSPYYLTPEFKSSLIYEQGLVRGLIPVFYTQSFFGTTPVIFQFRNILPFLINPLLTIIFIPSFFYHLFKAIKTKNLSLLLLNSYFLLLLLPQAFLFAKWTRYMIPALPFSYLLIAITISDLWKKRKIVLSIFVLTNILFGVSYFITTFVRSDTRIAAADFAKTNIQKNATILSEPYDLGLMPFSRVSQNVKIFNFYELDSNSADTNNQTVGNILQNSDYIILPSQRLLRSRLLNAKRFPKGHAIYSLLVNEALGYQNIYQSPCDIFCKITYLGDPIFGFEETATVFDRPTVLIFKKLR